MAVTLTVRDKCLLSLGRSMLMEVSAETVVMEPDPSPVRCHLWQVRYFQFLAELGPLKRVEVGWLADM